MKIFVFSDTHSRIAPCVRLIDRVGVPELLIHLGDVLKDVEDLNVLYPALRIECVPGNGDYLPHVSGTRVISCENMRIMLSHGHMHNVKNTLATYAAKAKEQKVDLALFGHTHQPFNGIVDNVRLLNPGSPSLPASGGGTYGLVEIKNGDLTTSIESVD